jgi:hypothetical protein
VLVYCEKRSTLLEKRMGETVSASGGLLVLAGNGTAGFPRELTCYLGEQFCTTRPGSDMI